MIQNLFPTLLQKQMNKETKYANKTNGNYNYTRQLWKIMRRNSHKQHNEKKTERNQLKRKESEGEMHAT